MENEDHFSLRTRDQFGHDVEIWNHKGKVWLVLDPNTESSDGASQSLTPEQARLLATALNRFADKVY
jgi:hypothetical protein